jgi:hypothetical protein
MKKKLKNIAGVTLIEILIGIVISVIMMAAMYSSYNVVNSVFQQVTDKAKISQSGREILGMLLRDIRLAGYKDFGDTIKTSIKHQPILITKSSSFGSSCDKIDIVYGGVDYDENEGEGKRYTYERYKITYECKKSKIIDKRISGGSTYIDAFAIYKSKIKWNETKGDWDDGKLDGNEKTYQNEKIIDHVQDLIFNAVDENGKIIKPPPSQTQNSDKIYKIRTVDIGLTVRSTEEFYKKKNIRKIFGLNDGARYISKNDKYLRDTIIVTAHARNLGL